MMKWKYKSASCADKLVLTRGNTLFSFNEQTPCNSPLPPKSSSPPKLSTATSKAPVRFDRRIARRGALDRPWERLERKRPPLPLFVRQTRTPCLTWFFFKAFSPQVKTFRTPYKRICQFIRTA